MSNYNDLFMRNLGIFTPDQQETLRSSTVVIAGCGGVGGHCAEQLARIGIGSLKIADPDVFEFSNNNRQAGSAISSFGLNKAQVIGDRLMDINPELKLSIFPDGVTEKNVVNFIDKAGVVIDGIDFMRFKDSVLLHREARGRGISVINPQAVGYGASVMVFGPKGKFIEEYAGLDSNCSLIEAANFPIPFEKFCPYLPTYVGENDPDLLGKIIRGEHHIPTVAPALYLSTSIAVSEAVMLLLGIHKPPAGDPRIISCDLRDVHFVMS